MRTHYWTIGPFADWLRGTPYPKWAGFDEWDEIHAAAKAAHPFRYWLVETGLDKLQVVVCWPIDAVRKLRYKLRSRFVRRHWMVDTGLSRWDWHETDERILYGMFALLVDFVEVQKASMHGPKLGRVGGLAHLDWEIGLTWPEDGGETTGQAIAAAEIKALYLWWKDTRPARTDPWTLVAEDSRADYDEKYGAMNELEAKYEAEDEEMLIRLIKLRRSLWT